jgi:ATP-dependent Lon protease
MSQRFQKEKTQGKINEKNSRASAGKNMGNEELRRTSFQRTTGLSWTPSGGNPLHGVQNAGARISVTGSIELSCKSPSALTYVRAHAKEWVRASICPE